MTACPICLARCRWNGYTTPCGHRFHRSCLSRAGPKCPLCRRLIRTVRVHNCSLFSVPGARQGFGRRPEHIHAVFELKLTPTRVVVVTNGKAWKTFVRRDRDRLFYNAVEGFLRPSRRGVAWGKIEDAGARDWLLDLPRDTIEEVHAAIRPPRN